MAFFILLFNPQNNRICFLEEFKMNEIFAVTIFDILHIFCFKKTCFPCIMHLPNGVLKWTPILTL
jgi:hypothetical protein